MPPGLRSREAVTRFWAPDTTWIAAAMTDGDRLVAGRGVTEAEGFRVRLLAFDPDDWRQHYDSVCNEALWFAHHGLYDRARRPVVDRAWWAAWDDYVAVNQTFAAGVAEAGAVHHGQAAAADKVRLLYKVVMHTNA